MLHPASSSNRSFLNNAECASARLFAPSMRRDRKGAVPLEFSMALPTLIIVLFLILWLGLFMIEHGNLTIQNRNKVWREREEPGTSQPFQFGQLSEFSQSDKGKVNLGGLFKLFPDPKASHTVLRGSWDWHLLPLDRAPDWDLYLQAAKSAPGNDLANRFGEVQMKFASLNNLLNTNLTNGLSAETFKNALGPILGPLDEVLMQSSTASATTNAGKQAADQSGKEKLPKMEKTRDDLKTDIENTLPKAIEEAKAAIKQKIGAIDWQALSQILEKEQVDSIKRETETLGAEASKINSNSADSNVLPFAIRVETAVNNAKAKVAANQPKVASSVDVAGLKSQAKTLDDKVHEINDKRKKYALAVEAVDNLKKTQEQSEKQGSTDQYFNDIPKKK